MTRDPGPGRASSDSEAQRLTSAAVATAGGDRVGVILGLQPAWREASLVAPAFTASGVAGDNLVLHRALAEAPAGSALVASLEGEADAGHWGELMCVAASAAGIRGLVVSGAVRDLVQIRARRFPVFHVGVGPRPAGKDHRGELGGTVHIGGAAVSSGDLIVADADGVAVIARDLVDTVLADVLLLEQRETELMRVLESGTSTLDALDLA